MIIMIAIVIMMFMSTTVRLMDAPEPYLECNYGYDGHMYMQVNMDNYHYQSY